MSEQTPADIITRARKKTQAALLACHYGEIARVCDEFMEDTGLIIKSVTFNFTDVSTIGGEKKSFIASVSIDHETP